MVYRDVPTLLGFMIRGLIWDIPVLIFAYVLFGALLKGSLEALIPQGCCGCARFLGFFRAKLKLLMFVGRGSGFGGLGV